MPTKPHIYTRRGDKGKTSLLTGERIEKNNPRVEAYGTIDELNSSLGVAKAHSNSRIAEFLQSVQQNLFYIAAELATPHEDATSEKIIQDLQRVETSDVTALENIADILTEELPLISNFVIPGGTKSAAFIHLSRTICRRAERRVVHLSTIQSVRPPLIKYLNRLSDALFVMARYSNVVEGDGDYLISREGIILQTKDD